MNNKKLILFGLIFIVLGIILGAIAAHYLETVGVMEKQIESFKVGTTYLFLNGLGLLAIAGIAHKFDFELNTVFRSITVGTILFSGSIFCLVFLPLLGLEINKIIGPITPIGGVIMIFGWLVLLIKHLRTYKS